MNPKSLMRRGIRSRIRTYAFIALLAFCVGVSAQSAEVYRGQGLFGEILVYDDQDGFRVMEFARGAARQSLVRLNDPLHIEFEYARIALVSVAFSRQPPRRVLVMGLGGGTLPVFFHRTYPDVLIDVVEIDPEVVRISKRYFNVEEDQRLRIHVGDGRNFLEKVRAETYDIIILDAFGASEVPIHLRTQEFLRAVRRALRPDGVSVSNIWGPTANASYFDMMATHHSVFDEIYAVQAVKNVNVLVFGLAQQQRLTRTDVAFRVASIPERSLARYRLEEAVRSGWSEARLAAHQGRILRDATLR